MGHEQESAKTFDSYLLLSTISEQATLGPTKNIDIGLKTCSSWISLTFRPSSKSDHQGCHSKQTVRWNWKIIRRTRVLGCIPCQI